MKNVVFWDVMSCGSCNNIVSEERIAVIIRVTGIGELRTKLTQASCEQILQILVTTSLRISLIVVTLMIETTR
jgi:hypothetical protein